MTASADRTARLWLVSVDDLLAEAERLIQRDPPRLTPEERRRFLHKQARPALFVPCASVVRSVE